MRTGSFARFFLAGLLALVSTAALTAPAGHHDIRWDDRGGAALRAHVAPGASVEWCGDLRLGESVKWEFEAADPLDMNIHHHEGRAVHYAVQRDAALAWAGTLQVTQDQNFCWMWTNRSTSAIALQARLQKPLGGQVQGQGQGQRQTQQPPTRTMGSTR